MTLLQAQWLHQLETLTYKIRSEEAGDQSEVHTNTNVFNNDQSLSSEQQIHYTVMNIGAPLQESGRKYDISLNKINFFFHLTMADWEHPT